MVVAKSFSNVRTATLKSQAALENLLNSKKLTFSKVHVSARKNLEQKTKGCADHFVAKVLCPPESCVRSRNVENSNDFQTLFRVKTNVST